MNITFLLWAVFVAFWCWGFMNAFLEGEILGGIGKVLRKTLPSWVADPTFSCQVCMASIHGSIWYLIACFYFHDLKWNFFLHVLFVVSVSGFNYVLTKITKE